MEQMSTYSIKIRQSAVHRKTLSATAGIYRKAVGFFIAVCLKEWDRVSTAKGQNGREHAVESLTVRTAKRKTVLYDFGRDFYKFPSYLRRAAIAEAAGKVSSYMSNLSAWEASDPRSRGKRPGYPSAGYAYPAMYRDNMFVRTGTYTARIKVFTRDTWDWLDVELCRGDADYILRHCGNRKECAPTLQKRGKLWYLDFSFKEDIKLPDRHCLPERILAVDLGISSACACSVVCPDGTVAGREFLRLPAEYDCLDRALGRIRRAQMHGARKTPRLWARAKGINDRIAVLTADFIVRTAVLYGADVIAMEHLDVRGRKRGSKRQRLHHWRAMYVQQMVAYKAHREGIRISTVCAWNTSRLAFDGSGRVLRGRESERTGGNYSLCEFRNGKVYNCDLNASYNIGARYFIREIIKSLPATAGQQLEAKVPSAVKRSTCTLSTLISLHAVLAAAAA